MPDLETRLRALGAETQFPPTPDLARAVRARLSAPEPEPAPAARRERRRRRSLAIAIALALLVPAAAVAAVPSTRHAVLDWLGLRSVRVRTVPAPPTPSVSLPPSTRGLGRPVALAVARARLPFTVRVPAALGSPQRVFYGTRPPGGRVTFLYGAEERRPRLLVTEFRGSQTRAFLEKLLGPGTTAQRVSVAGAPGVWLSGRPHGFIYADAHGAIHDEQTRLAGNVLLWERDGVVFRLEGRLSQDAAVRIGRSFH
jgi:hypothetical protein